MRSRYACSTPHPALSCIHPDIRPAYESNPHRFSLLVWLASRRNSGCTSQRRLLACPLLLHLLGSHWTVLQYPRYVASAVMIHTHKLKCCPPRNIEPKVSGTGRLAWIGLKLGRVIPLPWYVTIMLLLRFPSLYALHHRTRT